MPMLQIPENEAKKKVVKPGIPPQLGKPQWPGGGASRPGKWPEKPAPLPKPRRRALPAPPPTKGGSIGIPERGMRPRRAVPQRRPSLGGQGRFFLD